MARTKLTYFLDDSRSIQEILPLHPTDVALMIIKDIARYNMDSGRSFHITWDEENSRLTIEETGRIYRWNFELLENEDGKS